MVLSAIHTRCTHCARLPAGLFRNNSQNASRSRGVDQTEKSLFPRLSFPQQLPAQRSYQYEALRAFGEKVGLQYWVGQHGLRNSFDETHQGRANLSSDQESQSGPDTIRTLNWFSEI
jgi:hypothetical protein